MQVIALYVTGAVNEILSPEHQKEIIRYICNHQVKVKQSPDLQSPPLLILILQKTQLEKQYFTLCSGVSNKFPVGQFFLSHFCFGFVIYYY